MRNGSRVPIAPGVYRDRTGYSVIARVGAAPRQLRSPELRFPLETPLETLTATWHAEKAKLLQARGAAPARVTAGTLRADVARYFRAATLSPQRTAERRYQLDWWLAAFGDRRRHSLTHLELTMHLNTLRGAASTRNHYRMALYHLFTVLDGKNGPNPLRDVRRAKELSPADQPRRDQPYAFINLLFSYMRPSRTKARLMVLAFAPVTQAQLKRMSPHDIDYTAALMRTPGRQKGAGTKPRTKPLTPIALAVFRAFDAANVWKYPDPSNASIGRSFKLARDKAIAYVDALPAAERTRRLPDLDRDRARTMTPYALRHSFGTLTYALTGDITAAGALLDHSDHRTTLRYAHGAVPEHLKRANAQLAAAFAAAAVPAPHA